MSFPAGTKQCEENGREAKISWNRWRRRACSEESECTKEKISSELSPRIQNSISCSAFVCKGTSVCPLHCVQVRVLSCTWRQTWLQKNCETQSHKSRAKSVGNNTTVLAAFQRCANSSTSTLQSQVTRAEAMICGLTFVRSLIFVSIVMNIFLIKKKKCVQITVLHVVD